MASSETSNAPSRTIGLKPLLVGLYSMKSNSTISDLIDPFFNAAVPGWSPSKVRNRIAILLGLRLVDVDEAGLGQRLAHLVHVEPENAGRKLLALAIFVRMALLALDRDLGRVLPADHHDAVVIGDHGIAG